MIHRNCGGEIVEDTSKVYWLDGDEPLYLHLRDYVHAWRCLACGQEIVGDEEIFLEGVDE